MSERAAIVTGASSGIGLAIARVLGQEGYDLTVAARGPDRLAVAAEILRGEGHAVEAVAANVASEVDIQRVLAAHRDRFGRLDVLVNNAGMGVAGPITGYPTKHMDLQFNVNLRSVMIFYREALELLCEAADEHRNALVVNTSSITGKMGFDGLSVYSATKHGVVGFTKAMNREYNKAGVKSCVLCPGYVDTPMSDYVKDKIPSAEMIRSEDVAEAVRYLLRLSAYCLLPEVVLMRPGDSYD